MRIESLLGQHPRSKAGAVALTDGTRTVTYGELQNLVRSEADFLSCLAGSRFALLARNSCGWVLTDLALQHSNKLIVPLPRNFTSQQLVHAMEEANVDVIITDDVERVLSLLPGLQHCGPSPCTGLHALRRQKATITRTEIPEGTAKITYTSGSTSEPKGVCLSASSINRTSRAVTESIKTLRISRHLSLLPLATLLENVAGVHSALRLGASCIVVPEESTGMSYSGIDVSRLIDTLKRWQPESLILVPELLRLLIGVAHSGHSLSFLKFVAVGGATVSAALLEEARSVGIPAYEGYGLSECASVVCLNTPAASRTGSVGRPLSHVRVRCDERGQIHVGGTSMLGYLGSPESHRCDEIATGDIGTIDDDGFVYVRGRIRNVFISSFGRNVSPEWIERELTVEGAIRHAFVVGEGQPYPVALVVPASPQSDLALVRQAIERANTRLPDYARISEWSAILEVPSIANGQLTVNGRLRRERVHARHAALIERLSHGALRKAS